MATARAERRRQAGGRRHRAQARENDAADVARQRDGRKGAGGGGREVAWIERKRVTLGWDRSWVSGLFALIPNRPSLHRCGNMFWSCPDAEYKI